MADVRPFAGSEIGISLIPKVGDFGFERQYSGNTWLRKSGRLGFRSYVSKNANDYSLFMSIRTNIVALARTSPPGFALTFGFACRLFDNRRGLTTTKQLLASEGFLNRP